MLRQDTTLGLGPLNSMLGEPGLSRFLVLLRKHNLSAGLIWTFSYQFLIHVFDNLHTQAHQRWEPKE